MVILFNFQQKLHRVMGVREKGETRHKEKILGSESFTRCLIWVQALALALGS